ncbi:perlucin-like protein [Mercenaria mercenaria]|uniref:perlucin-like protein n=1 Tax=Mercenaria mercenaria TaxID=6596 RepID=UPI00234EA97B|nr:perlucin-like protein [Mercenaria mercenaria]
MNVIAYNDVYLFFFFSVSFVSFQTTLSVALTKFRRDFKLDGVRCVAEDTIFQAENISTSVECSKICYKNKLCHAIFYQPDLLTCIGCGGFGSGVEILSSSTCFVQDQMKCPQSWIQDRWSCYFISSDKKSWTIALEACREKGGDLVEVTDIIENNFLMSNIPLLKYKTTATGFWIGMTDKERNDTFVWISSGQIPSLNVWGPGQPSHDKDEDCAYYYKDEWNDIWCENEMHYICERGLQGVCSNMFT